MPAGDERGREARADVVVVTHNSERHARNCVEPLCRDHDLSVVVVDNASTDGTLDSLAGLPLEVIACDDNRGFAFGCNVGWRAGRAPTVIFLNPDAEADPGALLTLAGYLEADRRAGAVGPKILEQDGAVALSQRRFPSFVTSLAAAFFLPRVWKTTKWSLDIAASDAYAAPRSPDWISGACVAVRRELLEELDGFDERFFMYYEDMDICRRVRDQGFDVRYEPTATIVHAGAGSAPRARMIPVLARSRLLYAAKHGGRRGELQERLATVLHALTHMVLTTQGADARRGYGRQLLMGMTGPPTRARR